jgi:hypothetical protein
MSAATALGKAHRPVLIATHHRKRGNGIYASAITCDSRLRGKGGSKHDERIVVTVRSDDNGSGAGYDDSDPVFGSLQDDLAIDRLFG